MNKTLPFTNWARWFAAFADRQLPLPKPQQPELTRQERKWIGRSIRHFQLGESSDARLLLQKAGRYAAETGDISYPWALRGFVQEENRHAALLGRFMDQEGLPRARKSWMDSVFRRVRHALGLRHSIVVLLTAEFIAVPYYTALGQATSSQLLATICRQILEDEAHHLHFQSLALHVFSRRLSPWSRRAGQVFARLCLAIALPVVWCSHRRVLCAGGYDYRYYRKTCLRAFRHSRAVVAGQIMVPAPATPVPPPTPNATSRTDDLPNRPVTRNMFRFHPSTSTAR
ncbi:MAG: ferritin-like domain-containing protein [Bacteroidota bacterium]